MLYHQELPEIYTIDSNEIDSESEDLGNEWCLNDSVNLQEVEVGQISAVLQDFASSARPRGNAASEIEYITSVRVSSRKYCL